MDKPLNAQNRLDLNELTRRLQPQLAGLTATDQTEFLQLIKPTVGIKDSFADDETIAVGESKIGGRPDLPPSFDWPAYNNEPLAFCAQYNLADAAPFDLEQLLPRQGLLSVFIYIDQDWPGFFNDTGSYRVVYSDDPSRLQRTDFPANYFQGGIFPASRLTFFQYYTTPSTDNYKLNHFDSPRRQAFGKLAGAVQDIADSVSGIHILNLPQFPTHNNHQLLGEDRPIQASVMYYIAKDLLDASPLANDVTTTNGEKIDLLEREYIILLQLDADSNYHLHEYGDGTTYFGIKPDDLKNKRFDRVIMVFQGT